MSENKDKKPTQTFDLLECDEGDVICFGKEDTYKISKWRAVVYSINFCHEFFNELLRKGIKIERQTIGDTREWNNENYLNLVRGIDCSILQQSGGGWKKGKFKMKLILETWDDEEKPEESESPLIDEEILQLIGELDRELGTKNFLPIFHLREKLQPPLGREELDQALYRLQGEEKIELSSLVEAVQYTQEQIEAGIPQDTGGPLFFLIVV